MKELAMAGVLAVAAIVALPAETRADWRVGGVVVVGRDDWRGRSDAHAFRYGYERGWREGSQEGHNDGRRNRDPRFWRESDFRDGDEGYRRWMGSKSDYVSGFRRGYEAAYRKAYASARPHWRDRDRRGREPRYGERDWRDDDRDRDDRR
jgi:hypothetical protein